MRYDSEIKLQQAFNTVIKEFENYTLEECRKLGINESMIHVDFMVGTKDMDIKAETRDGKTIQIFKNGNWAF